jgi:hypothetical protein
MAGLARRRPSSLAARRPNYTSEYESGRCSRGPAPACAAPIVTPSFRKRQFLATEYLQAHISRPAATLRGQCEAPATGSQEDAEWPPRLHACGPAGQSRPNRRGGAESRFLVPCPLSNCSRYSIFNRGPRAAGGIDRPPPARVGELNAETPASGCTWWRASGHNRAAGGDQCRALRWHAATTDALLRIDY